MKSKIPDLYTTEDEDPDMMTGSDQEKAETLRNFFSSVFTNEPEGTWEFLDKPEIRHSLNINITEDKLLKKLQKLKISKSAGPDGVHPRVLLKWATGCYSQTSNHDLLYISEHWYLTTGMEGSKYFCNIQERMQTCFG